ncbi:MAG TPA: SDR family oxidoreductase [Solirubrobacteraceae bacterium]|jgi:NAD(P)-dependent dehydrogenase (short-subunit alcohol dehydrogenase family)|nr:SDR family oxidoreductase [Solirubrobacteraceae bacterium]
MGVEIDMSGKAALVTGGGSGIGRETCLLLARAGAQVTAADLNPTAAAETVSLIEQQGGQAHAVEVDVQRPDQASAAVASAIERFGKLDVLVNNAACWTIKLFRNQTHEDILRDVGVTLIGTMTMTSAAYEPMREQRSGVVVNLISDSGRVGEPFLVPYGAAKAGVVGFTKGFAKEAGRYGIRCNAVSPGTTITPGSAGMIEEWGGEEKLLGSYPLKRLGQPIDQANAILFLASDLTSWVTGQVLSVSGGYSMVD